MEKPKTLRKKRRGSFSTFQVIALLQMPLRMSFKVYCIQLTLHFSEEFSDVTGREFPNQFLTNGTYYPNSLMMSFGSKFSAEASFLCFISTKTDHIMTF